MLPSQNITSTSTPTPTFTFTPSRRRDKRHSNQNNDQDELEEEEGWALTSQMKDAMKKSENIRKELADGGLRTIIQNIVNCGGGWRGRNQALSEAKRQCPMFAKFVDEVLLVTGVVSKHDQGISESDAISNALLGIHGGVILNPLPQKRKVQKDTLQKIVANEEYSDEEQDLTKTNASKTDDEDSSSESDSSSSNSSSSSSEED